MNRSFPTSWRSASLTACSAALLLLAACGGDSKQDAAPRIQPAAAQDLAGLSDEVADLIDAGDVCGAAHKADELKAHADASVAEGKVPPALAAQLQTNVKALVDEVNCPAPPPPPPPPAADEDEDNGGNDKNGKGKHENKGKKRKGQPPPPPPEPAPVPIPLPVPPPPVAPLPPPPPGAPG